MKYLIPLFILLLTACGSGDGSENIFETDTSTVETAPVLTPRELEITGEGLSSDDTYLYAGGMKTSSVYFKYGEKVYVNFINISGMKEIDGLIFPRIDGYVMNAAGDTLVKGVDLDLGIDDGYKPINGGIDLNSNIYFDRPFVPGANYLWEVYVRDRNSENFLKASAVLAITHNEEIVVTTKNSAVTDIYLYDLEEGFVIRRNKVFSGQSFKMYFDGLQGFNTSDDKIFLGMEISLEDKEGAQMLYAENALNEYAEDGLPAASMSESIYALVELPEGEFGKMTLRVRIYDLNGDAEVTGEVELDVVKLG